MKLYKDPPPQTHVLCIDEMGPLGAKLHFGKRWCENKDYPRVTPDYGKKGQLWVFGALEPATGEALTHTTERRRGVDFIAFLDEVVKRWPNDSLVLILDNLSVHKAVDVQLWAVAHERVRFLFQPTYSPWLNLIEPWWKTLRNLALRGKTFEALSAVHDAIKNATAYWNAHAHPYCWLKSY